MMFCFTDNKESISKLMEALAADVFVSHPLSVIADEFTDEMHTNWCFTKADFVGKFSIKICSPSHFLDKAYSRSQPRIAPTKSKDTLEKSR